MRKFLRFSSLTKKFIMAFAGAFLMVFLLVHLGINLFILPIIENHKEIFRDMVYFMTTNPLIEVMEYTLFGAFILHMLVGVILQIQNWMARPVRYKREGWSHTSFFSKFMIHTGIVIGIFLTIHLMNFYFVKEGFTKAPEGMMRVTDDTDFYSMAFNLFTNRTYSIIYIILLILTGFHLNHAFQSAFQSLGLNHSKYTPFIKAVGDLYSILVPLGFILIPLYFLIYY
jgi:succinate dehydrogenase / fumarate reductase, cytochrome b subunit